MAHAHDQLEALVESGLDLYGLDQRDEAVARWREALALAPDHHRVRHYLEAAGAFATPLRVVEPETEPSPPQIDSSTRATVLSLVRTQRLEEALNVLYDAHRKVPGDAGVSRSISVLKRRVLAAFESELGSLELIASVVPSPEQLRRVPITDDEREILRLVDGIVSYGDILLSTKRDRFSMTRALTTLRRKGVLRAGELPAVAPRASPPRDLELPLPPPSGPRPPPAPFTPPSADDFSALLARAVRAVLAGRLSEARTLLDHAASVCPADETSLRNLARLRVRVEKEGR